MIGGAGDALLPIEFGWALASQYVDSTCQDSSGNLLSQLSAFLPQKLPTQKLGLLKTHLSTLAWKVML